MLNVLQRRIRAALAIQNFATQGGHDCMSGTFTREMQLVKCLMRFDSQTWHFHTHTRPFKCCLLLPFAMQIMQKISQLCSQLLMGGQGLSFRLNRLQRMPILDTSSEHSATTADASTLSHYFWTVFKLAKSVHVSTFGRALLVWYHAPTHANSNSSSAHMLMTFGSCQYALQTRLSSI